MVTNLQYLRQIVADPRFSAGDTTTGFLQHVHYAPHAIEVLQPGMMTTVQDYPGRIAYWSVGVPPSGPMDAASHRVANALVGNDDAAAALEVTLSGPTLRFFSDHVVAVCGAQLDVLVDDEPVRMFASVPVKAGQVLRVGKIGHAGSRAYIAVSGGGVDVSEYLGSKSTFVGGGFGGHQGRALRAGDMLPIHSGSTYVRAVSVPPAWCPAIDGHHWNVHVLPGSAWWCQWDVLQSRFTLVVCGTQDPKRTQTTSPPKTSRCCYPQNTKCITTRTWCWCWVLQRRVHNVTCAETVLVSGCKDPSPSLRALMATRAVRCAFFFFSPLLITTTHTAPIECARPSVCDRHHQLHGRHACGADGRRPLTGRVCVPPDGHLCRPMEDGAGKAW